MGAGAVSAASLPQPCRPPLHPPLHPPSHDAVEEYAEALAFRCYLNEGRLIKQGEVELAEVEECKCCCPGAACFGCHALSVFGGQADKGVSVSGAQCLLAPACRALPRFCLPNTFHFSMRARPPGHSLAPCAPANLPFLMLTHGCTPSSIPAFHFPDAQTWAVCWTSRGSLGGWPLRRPRAAMRQRCRRCVACKLWLIRRCTACKRILKATLHATDSQIKSQPALSSPSTAHLPARRATWSKP